MENIKHSEWKVAKNPILQADGSLKNIYEVYRIIDITQVVHSGNIEYATGHLESEELAQKIADKLNNGEVCK